MIPFTRGHRRDDPADEQRQLNGQIQGAREVSGDDAIAKETDGDQARGEPEEPFCVKVVMRAKIVGRFKLGSGSASAESKNSTIGWRSTSRKATNVQVCSVRSPNIAHH